MSYGKNPVFQIPERMRRPQLPQHYANGQQNIDFQLLECTQTKVLPQPEISRVHHQEVPELRLYGVTAEGFSVCARVYNVEPYLWIEAPLTWDASHEPEFRRHLNGMLAYATKVQNTIVRIETHSKQSLLYYSGGRQGRFLKIVTQLPGFVPKIKAILAEGISFPALWDRTLSFPTYESNVIFTLRFLVDHDIGGCNWMTVPGGSYILHTRQKVTTAQLEFFVSAESITSHEAVGDRMKIAPFRILSIDIECQGRKGSFPEPQQDPVIQIACHCKQYGEENQVSRAIFTLNTCAPIASADVYSFPREEDMLVAFAQYLIQIDPDFLTGYNIIGFDFPYLIDRAGALKISNNFCIWSRVLGEKTIVRDKKFQSKQMGNREYKEVVAEGRVFLDVMVVIQRDYKLRSYSLNSVAQQFLEEQKEDVHHSIISDLQNGTDETRRRLAVYCLKDAYLPLRLIDKLMIIVNNVEMARVTGVPIGWLLERGQQIKVFSQMLRKAKGKDLLFPTVEYSGGDPSAAGKGYEGATVIPPKKGYYECPIVTLDFASLYPSIMMAHNLCYTTLVRPREVSRYDPNDLTKTPSGDYFVKKEKFPGILPEILDELLSARKRAKALMKEAKDELEYAVLNGRQLALKISANSVYGFTGAQVGKLPCLEISASVTAFGRQMIEATKAYVESHYEGTNVVYGDTDSVMIKAVTNEAGTDKERLEEAMAFGRKAAAEVTKEFLKPVKLEFEKVYFPFLLMNKKRYAGLYWTNTEKWDKLDAKGIETVRRDNCPLVANVISGVLNRILIQRSVQGAVDYVKGTISDLLMNRLDISQLVITKAYSKSEEEYQSKQAHVALAERMRQRDPGSAPSIGDRVAYVIIKAAKGALAFEKSEDPIYVLEHNVPIDTQYYLDHQLSGPLERVFEGVLEDPKILTHGDHTRHIAVVAPSANSGKGLMKFVKVKAQCLGCRNTLSHDGAVCETCAPIAPEIYCNILAKRNHYESVYAKVWTQCQQCQELLHQDVICTSRDCPVFYTRKKVQKDLREQQAMLDRFGILQDW